MGEIKYQGKSISSNPLNPQLQKQIIIHEIGHWTVSNHFGLESQIIYDPNTGLAYVETTYNATDNKLERLNQQITVGLGGLVAETISGFQTGGFLLGDLPIIFECVKERNNILGKPFNYTRFGQLMMSDEYLTEQRTTHNIIMKAGGAKYLNDNFKDILSKIK